MAAESGGRRLELGERLDDGGIRITPWSPTMAASAFSTLCTPGS